MLTIIHPLPVERWQEYRALRIAAVRDSPTAFGTTETEDSLLEASEWKNRLSPDSNVKMIFAELDGKLVGMIGICRDPMKKTDHIVRIISFFVCYKQRQSGIGVTLFQKAMQLAQKDGIIKIRLDVTTTQQEAMNLYEGFGFKKIGLLEKEVRHESCFYDQHIMERFL